MYNTKMVAAFERMIWQMVERLRRCDAEAKEFGISGKLRCLLQLFALHSQELVLEKIRTMTVEGRPTIYTY